MNALGGQSGGAVVLNARNGDVLALAGSAYSSPQPPGSTFKVITTTAALEGHDVKLTDNFPVLTEINPDPQNGARVVHNAHDEACGGTFVQAFAKSCNTVFAPLGVKVGAERLVQTSERYGWNREAQSLQRGRDRRHGSERNDDADGLQRRHEPHRPLGDGFRTGPGAGHAARDGVRRPDRRQRRRTQPDLDRQGPGAEERCEARSGDLQGERQGPHRADARRRHLRAPGVAANIPGIQVAGKTGTAELGPKPGQPPAPPGEENTVEQIVDGWFICFAPAQHPKLAVAVMLIDASGDGGSTAAPIASNILTAALR